MLQGEIGDNCPTKVYISFPSWNICPEEEEDNLKYLTSFSYERNTNNIVK